MKNFIEALNRPADAYNHQLKGVSWALVVTTILVTTIFEAILRGFTGMDILHTLTVIILGVGSYLIISFVLWLICRIFGSRTPLAVYVKTWGISFFPNVICAMVVAVTEVYFYVFWNSALWGMILSIVFVGILFWKIILYVIFLREVAGMGGIKLMGAFIVIALIVGVLTAVNGYVGLKTPIL